MDLDCRYEKPALQWVHNSGLPKIMESYNSNFNRMSPQPYCLSDVREKAPKVVLLSVQVSYEKVDGASVDCDSLAETKQLQYFFQFIVMVFRIKVLVRFICL
jgi:hypothetical protein